MALCVDGYRGDYRHDRLRYRSVGWGWVGTRLYRPLPKDILDELDYHNCRGPYVVRIAAGVNLRGGEGSHRRRHYPVQCRCYGASVDGSSWRLTNAT